MFEVPLFPLHTVLFPGMTLHLHIFEERYKRMIRLCLETRQPFGVVLIRRGLEALGPLAEPHSVGCLARIVEVNTLSEGRMNLATLGEERFRLLSLHADSAPYWLADVEFYPLVNPEPLAFARAVKHLRPLVDRFVQLLAESGSALVRVDQLPTDPKSFVYTAAAVLQTPPVGKQELLEIQTGLDLAERLQSVYRREIALMRSFLKKSSHGEERTFSRN